MMADRRRRSPEGSSKKRKESRRSDYDESQQLRSAGAEHDSYSSSSSSSYIDISRSFPPNRFGLRTFFTAPSERQRLRRQRSRLSKHSNSSSSSVNTDLAYGTGFIKRSKLRRVRSRKGKEIDRERDRERERERERNGVRDKERERPGVERAATDAEIIAVGAGLAKLAREQNKLDLKAARNGRRPELAAVKETSRNDYGVNRGLGPSKISHGSDTFDEDGWESASDGESESSVDSRLAFGGESKGGWSFFGRKKHKPMSRKSSVVDPRLFGPQNSLHGVVTQPVGFGEVFWTSSSDFGQHQPRDSYSVGPGESLSGSQSSLQRVYPVPTADPSRFEAVKSSATSVSEPYISSRPGPVPIQQPQPITPVSQSVYEPIYTARSESGGILKMTQSSSGRSKSLAEAALVGVAGVAVGAAIASSRDERKDRRRYDEHDELDKERPRRRDNEKIKESKSGDRREKRSSPDRKERKDKQRDKDKLKDDTDEQRRDKKLEKRRDETRDEKDERRKNRREERHAERPDDRYNPPDARDSRRTKSEASVSTTAVDPFQYQVGVDSFPTPNIDSSEGHRRVDSVPTVVTVEREPDFSRMRRSSAKDQPASSRSDYQKGYDDGDDGERRYRDRDARDRALHDAEAIYQETEHSTAPIEIAAIGAAVAAVTAEEYRESRSDRRRDERKNERRADYGDYDREPRDKEAVKKRDLIQEEADRAYREIVMARKIASQVIRSRSPSPDRSVVEKYDEDKQEKEIVRIVTPPGMEDHKKQGPYDAPNADFQLDYVLENPIELRNFSIPGISLDASNPQGSYLKKDPDASKPRPLLNLVRPTPTPSPMPEKQAEKEAARSESSSSPKSTDQGESKSPSSSEVVIGPKGNVVSSPTISTASKGVTWGENETKHFDVGSPSEHRDEFVSSADIKTQEGQSGESKSRESQSQSQEKPAGSKPRSKGWGAIAAGIMGASIGGAATNASETSKTSKSPSESSETPKNPTETSNKSDAKEKEAKQDRPYEYRGVTVEPDSSPRSQRQRSPPSTGPKPSSAEPSHIPGAFDDDLDFTATVAAGLQDTGFDPNIVINDPSFRRRESPPGSNESGMYRAPFAETLSDFGALPSDVSGPRGPPHGFVMGDVASTPQDWRNVSPPPETEDYQVKLSQKEQKKREKAARRESGDVTPLDNPSTSRQLSEEQDDFEIPKLSNKERKKRDKVLQRESSQAEDINPLEEPSVANEIVEEPESYFETPKKSKKKSKKGSSADYDELEDTPRDSRKVSVPIDAFDDLRNGEDEWAEPKKSKKSKRDSKRLESPVRSIPSSEIASEVSSSKKSKDKSKRKSEQYEVDPTEASLPPSTPSENSRDGDFDDSRRTRQSSTRESGIFSSADRGESQSVVSASTSGYTEEEPRKAKKKSRSRTRDDYDDIRSVASAPAGDDFEDSKRSKKKDKDKRNSGGFFGLFGSKSEVSARDENPNGTKGDFDEVKKKKKKRNSVPDGGSIDADPSSQSINNLARSVSNGNGNGSYRHDDEKPDSGSRSDGEKKTRSRSESASSKKDSFLAKAGTLGAGVGIAGAAVAIAAQHHLQSKADNAAGSEAALRDRVGGSERSLPGEELDPEIMQKQFRPSIDPQYGDLLPLPPSDPASPDITPLDNLPELPDSRPDTPEAERLTREKPMSTVRKSVQEAPIKSPSQSAVPLKFLMGNRSTPSSPGAVRSTPLQSPATPNQDSSFPRYRSRPTSWDNSKEYKPLYLVESNRRGSNVQQIEPEESLPALPPSQRTSRSSSELELSETMKDSEQSPLDTHPSVVDVLSVDTNLASAKATGELLDSEQSTPKAEFIPPNDSDITSPAQSFKSFVDDSDLPHENANILSPPAQKEHFHPVDRGVEETVVEAGLVSTISHVTSSPAHQTTEIPWNDELPSIQRQPSPVDPATKDRSSYLLLSSPIPRNYDETDSGDKNVDFPSGTQNSWRDALYSIPERKGAAIIGSSSEPLLNAQQERDRAFETLTGISSEERAQGLANAEAQSSRHEGLEEPAIDEEAEPADEFVFTKSKKDKKKDKKKRKKGESSSSWEPEEDSVSAENTHVLKELSLSSGGKMSEPTATPDYVEQDDTFSTSKSKKEKKKDKKGKSFLFLEQEEGSELQTVPEWESRQKLSNLEEPLLETNQHVSESAADPVDMERDEEFSTPKSKKDKKKNKKKSKLVMSWEEVPEEHNLSQSVPEGEPETNRAVLEETYAPDNFEQFSNPHAENNQAARSASSWEPENDVLPAQSLEAPIPELSRNLVEEPLSYVVESTTSETKTSGPEEMSVAKLSEEGNLGPASRAIQPENYREISQGAPMPDDFVLTESEKSRSAMDPEPENAIIPSESISQEIQPEDSRNVSRPTDIADDFVAFEKTKKGKKKKDTSSTRELDQTTLVPTSEGVDDFQEFVQPRSKKSKKGKRSQSLALEEGLSMELQQEITEDLVDAPGVAEKSQDKSVDQDDFSTFPAKKNKKNSSEPSVWDPELESSQDTVLLQERSHEDVLESAVTGNADEFATLTSKRGKAKKKSRKSQGFDIEDRSAESETLVDEAKALGTESPHPAPETPTSRPTPTGGPGAWPITPATPWTADPQSSKSELSRVDYFSSDASFSTREISDDKDSRNKDQFSSAAALLPVAIAGAAAAGLQDAEKDTSPHVEDGHVEAAFETFEYPLPQMEHDTKSPPDGLNAGYDNEQLRLARQLQEEFNSGTKSLKKGKKKRQSLPSTPGRVASKDRNVEMLTADHPRARSLSAGPSAERSGDNLAASERKSLYSEEQLEVARQLKADFEMGNKTSKKDKKRSRLSRSMTEDDESFGQNPDESQIGSSITEDVPTSEIPDTKPKGDGFAAGYEKDQLALARQLQPEFGTGSKKSKESKKEKKRRSLSQTHQEQEPRNDYFGEPSELPPSEPLHDEVVMPESNVDKKETVRDGLAVGYNEEQLELARQLKEEFGSSTKKLKKDRKDKKRQSLLRSNTEDDFSSDALAGGIDASQQELVEETGRDAGAAEPEENIAFVTKKSKKDKKGKKRESILRSLTDDGPTLEIQPTDSIEPQDADLPRELVEERRNELVIAEPENEFAIGTRNSKKNKKGKKRDSILRNDSEADIPSDDFGKAVEALHNVDELRSADDETTPVETFSMQHPEEDFASAGKKFKKYKMNLQNLEGSLDQPETEAVAAEHPTNEEFSAASGNGLSFVAEGADEPLDLFGFPSRKSKKEKKKRQSLLRSSAFDKAPEQWSEFKDPQLELPSEALDLGDGFSSEIIATPVVDERGDGLEFKSKKSKNDEKGKGSQQTYATDDPSRQPEDASAKEGVQADEDLQKGIHPTIPGAVFSLPETSNDVPAIESNILKETQLAVHAPDVPLPEPSRGEPALEQDILLNQPAEDSSTDIPQALFGDYTFTAKKPKKGKKKQKDSPKTEFEEASGFSTPLDLTDEPQRVVELHSSIESAQEQIISAEPPLEQDLEDFSTAAIQKTIEEPSDQGSFWVKKSKKNKRKDSSKPDSEEPSGYSTPFQLIVDPTDDTPQRNLESRQDLPRKPEITDTKSRKDSEEGPGDEWDSFSTKKSKKDRKKRSSGLSTPINDSLPAREMPDETEQSVSRELAIVEAIPSNENFEEEGEKWDSFSTKKSKNGKKRKSGLSIPIEDALPADASEKDSTSVPEDSLIREPDVSETPATGDNVGEPADEWPSFSTKKSKKGKKKQISGISTSTEESLPVTLPGPSEAVEPVSTSDVQEPKDEWDSFTIKKAKPDKKGRKVDVSTPNAETTTPESEKVSSKSKDNDHEANIEQVVEQNIWKQEPTRDLGTQDNETADDAFAFIKQRSEDQKAQIGSHAESETRNSTPTHLNDAALPDPGAGDHAEHIFVPERLVASPVPLEKQIPLETKPGEEMSPVFAERELDFLPAVASGNLSRKSSKTDKRKRQATVDVSATDDSSSTKPPLTSWADEVEEAEVERELPVIEEIAKDESLSHIASTMEKIPRDDFTRPTKKGKKGKKRNSTAGETSSLPEIVRPPFGEDLARDEHIDEHSSVPLFTATGAALASAELLKKAGEMEREEGASRSDQAIVGKRSKKELKKSIDQRPAPRDDPFDDPSLWEGGGPQAFKDSDQAKDDYGSDGFGSALQKEDEKVQAHEPKGSQQPILGDEDLTREEQFPISQPIGTTSPNSSELYSTPESQFKAIEPQLERELELQPEVRPHIADTQTTRQSPRPEQQWKDLPEEFNVNSSSKKDEEMKKQSHLPVRDPETAAVESSVTQAPTQPSSSEPPQDKGISFEEAPTIIQEDMVGPQVERDQPRIERSVSPQGTPIQWGQNPRLSSSRFYQTGFSDLPVVHEENTTQSGSDKHQPHQTRDREEGNRDSAFVTGSPTPPQKGFTDNHEHVRDSGVHLRDFSPAERAPAPVLSTDDALARLSWPSVDEERETVDLHRSQRLAGDTSSKGHHVEPKSKEQHGSQKPKDEKPTDVYRLQGPTEERPLRHHDAHITSRDELPSERIKEDYHTDLHRTQTIHETRKPKEESLVKQRVQRIDSPDLPRSQKPKEEKYAEPTPSQRPKAEKPKGISDLEAGAAVAGASLGFAAARKLSQERRPSTPQSQRSASNINRLRTPDINRPESVNSNRSSGTPPLRRSDRKSGDLRSLSQRSKPDLAKEAELAALTSAAAAAVNTANPTANEGRVRAKDMADVYDGFGEGRMGSPRSPTRPHSMRRRQSMQVLDLESKVEQLATENRMLAEFKAQAERTLQSSQHASSSLVEKDAEIDSLKRSLEWLQNEVSRLTEVNDGLTSANVTLARQHGDRYGILESQHSQTTRELEEARDAHNTLSADVEGIVRNEVQKAVQGKDQEIAQLRAELDAAKEQIRAMQRQILTSKANDSEFLTIRDEDYFDNACQQLCQHVQQWVLRFSKFSDMRACRLTSEINNDKTIDRLDNAILDGSDVDSYLADRIKRRDVFMSMTMTMVWEFVFTRYLFGMDREQRQKLKSLEKTLSEVGPASAVHQWRATTLTLLAKREAFAQQREQDTQAVVHAVLETLTEILPPPSHLEAQIEEQLTRVMKAAVDLSIEMRTQRAEYMMLPPLQPEYDANGDLASKVSFNAALMNERSGDTVSNEELEAQKAVVRIVLFPLVVKKGNDEGEGDEEIVVCPAQVLVAKPKKQVRVFSPESVGVASQSRVSMQSSMPADYGESAI